MAAGLVAGLVAVALFAGCAGQLRVDAPVPQGRDAERCDRLADAAPDQVAGADAREVDGAGVALAWGDPAITIRCAVPVPGALEPGSRCDTVESVDWFTEEGEDGYRFSTVGRATTVELFVPYEYEPAGDALVDVAAAVRRSVPVVEGCR